MNTKLILSIDPGPVQSAWVLWDGTKIHDKGIHDNQVIVNSILESFIMTRSLKDIPLVIEQIKSYGMTVSDTIFDTVFWTGRFCQAWEPGKWVRVPRMEVKMHLCHQAKAKDANIRQAILDRFGGKEKAIGKKSCPGIFYGVKADEWSALALAITYFDQHGGEK